jgi:hypothetical protein
VALFRLLAASNSKPFTEHSGAKMILDCEQRFEPVWRGLHGKRQNVPSSLEHSRWLWTVLQKVCDVSGFVLCGNRFRLSGWCWRMFDLRAAGTT